MARLILTEAGEDVTVGGSVNVIGTSSGGEVISVVFGTIVLDPSFNRGGDTVRLPGEAVQFTIRASGAQVILEGSGVRLTMPAGTAGMEISFSDVTRTLMFDVSAGVLKLGSQTITAAVANVTPAGMEPTLIGTEGADTLKGTVGGDIIDGLGGNDDIDGGAGNDVIYGGLGDDTLWGSLGDDQTYGGPGADRIFDNGGNTSFIDAGTGNDWVVLSSWAGSSYRVVLGDGDDYIGTSILNPGSFVIDAGPGADRVMVTPGSTGLGVTLGTGRDELVLPEGALSNGNFGAVFVNDFETGPVGDKIDFLFALSSYLTNWETGTNPFATGHLKLIDRLGAAVLQIDRDGPASNTQSLKDMIIFEGDAKATFTKENFGGYDPQVVMQGSNAHASENGATQFSASPAHYIGSGHNATNWPLSSYSGEHYLL